MNDNIDNNVCDQILVESGEIYGAIHTHRRFQQIVPKRDSLLLFRCVLIPHSGMHYNRTSGTKGLYSSAKSCVVRLASTRSLSHLSNVQDHDDDDDTTDLSLEREKSTLRYWWYRGKYRKI